MVAPGGSAAQARKALENMDAVLGACRVALEDVVFLRVRVSTNQRADLSLAWAVVLGHFGGHEMPATLQGVSVL